MGNRASVIFHSGDTISPAVYLHWNGGPESIYAFLDELNRREVRADANYECARFIAVVAEFFDHDSYGTASLGVSNGPTNLSKTALAPFVSEDNGLYLVTRAAGKNNVRRFKEDGETVVEMLPEEAALEEATARRSSYFDPVKGIPSKFDHKKPIRI